MENELLEFKKHLHLDIEIGSEYEQSFPEESFFEVAVTRLGEAGFWITQSTVYIRTRKGACG